MNCSLLAIDGCPLSSVSGPMEILSLANNIALANNLALTNSTTQTNEVANHKTMNLQVVGESSKQVDCLGGVQLTVHQSLGQVNETDLLIIGAIGHPSSHRLSTFDQNTILWIKQQYEQGAQIVSICSGAFLLAATGLLNGKKATTHWSCENLFRRHFPEVDLQSEHILTMDGKLCCSGGASAYQDMALFLVRQHFGEQVANQCAKALLIDPGRESQQQFASFNPCRQHQDNLIHQLQDWIYKHANEPFSIGKLADKAALSERQLKRRFKQATNETPLAYIQALRVESAKHHLETSNIQIEQISRLSGYEDVRFFRELFKRYTSLSPSEYRNKFRLK